MWKGGRGLEGKLIVISGFSGAGKGTVIRRMMQEHEGYALSVSMTTRKPREGEIDGVDYHYVSNETFEDLVRRDGLLEYAGFVDNYYGTPRAFVEENRRAGRDVLLEIEVDGAAQIRKKVPEALTIFLIPPSMEELERRIRGRRSEPEEIVQQRLSKAEKEMKLISDYKYVVCNDNVELAAKIVSAIIEAHME
jgi:guanylate kinase